MADYTEVGTYTLPSLGKVYSVNVNPEISIRAMTTEEEMRRLNHSDRPYQLLAGIIDDCLINKPGISSYDMCLGDFQFLLHKLRIVTYGTDYKVGNTCPYCGNTNTDTLDLSSMEVFSYSDKLESLFVAELPKTKHKIRLRMQTPRIVEDVTLRAKEFKKKHPQNKEDTAFLFTIMSLIETVDGSPLDIIQAEEFVRKLPMIDTNYILLYSQKLNECIGINTVLTAVCDFCGEEYKTLFKTTSEFFRPTFDL